MLGGPGLQLSVQGEESRVPAWTFTDLCSVLDSSIAGSATLIRN